MCWQRMFSVNTENIVKLLLTSGNVLVTPLPSIFTHKFSNLFSECSKNSFFSVTKVGRNFFMAVFVK
jgi:hypothetical protein